MHEIERGADPLYMLDDYDYLYDPTTTDSDGDGLSDAAEEDYGTDPDEPDTDGDGLSDGAEVMDYQSDPNSPDGDGDGLADQEEIFIFSTNPGHDDVDALLASNCDAPVVENTGREIASFHQFDNDIVTALPPYYTFFSQGIKKAHQDLITLLGANYAGGLSTTHSELSQITVSNSHVIGLTTHNLGQTRTLLVVDFESVEFGDDALPLTVPMTVPHEFYVATADSLRMFFIKESGQYELFLVVPAKPHVPGTDNPTDQQILDYYYNDDMQVAGTQMMMGYFDAGIGGTPILGAFDTMVNKKQVAWGTFELVTQIIGFSSMMAGGSTRLSLTLETIDCLCNLTGGGIGTFLFVKNGDFSSLGMAGINFTFAALQLFGLSTANVIPQYTLPAKARTRAIPDFQLGFCAAGRNNPPWPTGTGTTTVLPDCDTALGTLPMHINGNEHLIISLGADQLDDHIAHLTVEGGALYFRYADGSPVRTDGIEFWYDWLDDEGLYIYNGGNEFIVAARKMYHDDSILAQLEQHVNQHGDALLKHPTLAQFGDTNMAGMFKTDASGKVLRFDDASGHYKPQEPDVLKFEQDIQCRLGMPAFAVIRTP